MDKYKVEQINNILFYYDVDDGQFSYSFYHRGLKGKVGELFTNHDVNPTASIQIVWIDYFNRYVKCIGNIILNHLSKEEILKQQEILEKQKQEMLSSEIYFRKYPVLNIETNSIKSNYDLEERFAIVQSKNYDGFFVYNKKTKKNLLYTCSATEEEAIKRAILINMDMYEYAEKLPEAQGKITNH